MATNITTMATNQYNSGKTAGVSSVNTSTYYNNGYNAGYSAGTGYSVKKIYQNNFPTYGDLSYTFSKDCKFAIGTLIGEYNYDGKDGSYTVVAPHGYMIVQDAAEPMSGSSGWYKSITVLYTNCKAGDNIRLYGSLNGNMSALTIAE